MVSIKFKELNYFFTRFETYQPNHFAPQPNPPISFTFTTQLIVQKHDVRRLLLAVNAKKAASPDRVNGKVLRVCPTSLYPSLPGSLPLPQSSHLAYNQRYSSLYTKLLYSHTVQPTITSALSSLLMTPQWSDSFHRVMRQPTERRS